jgi:hypothetical protein
MNQQNQNKYIFINKVDYFVISMQDFMPSLKVYYKKAEHLT